MRWPSALRAWRAIAEATAHFEGSSGYMSALRTVMHSNLSVRTIMTRWPVISSKADQSSRAKPIDWRSFFQICSASGRREKFLSDGHDLSHSSVYVSSRCGFLPQRFRSIQPKCHFQFSAVANSATRSLSRRYDFSNAPHHSGYPPCCKVSEGIPDSNRFHARELDELCRFYASLVMSLQKSAGSVGLMNFSTVSAVLEFGYTTVCKRKSLQARSSIRF